MQLGAVAAAESVSFKLVQELSVQVGARADQLCSLFSESIRLPTQRTQAAFITFPYVVTLNQTHEQVFRIY